MDLPNYQVLQAQQWPCNGASTVSDFDLWCAGRAGRSGLTIPSFLALYLTSKAEHEFTKPYLKLQQQDTPKPVQPKAALQLSIPAG